MCQQLNSHATDTEALQERDKIAEELHMELLPGTEIMTDIGSHHFVKSSGKKHRVLVPQPSDNPHDPLNWSTGWKISAIVASSYVTFMQGFGPLSLAPMFGDYIEAFDCTLTDAVQFSGVNILVLGFSNFIWYVSCVDQAFWYSRTVQGTLEHESWSSSGLYSFAADLPGILDMARSSADLWQFHGSLYVSNVEKNLFRSQD